MIKWGKEVPLPCILIRAGLKFFEAALASLLLLSGLSITYLIPVEIEGSFVPFSFLIYGRRTKLRRKNQCAIGV
jgi:hypothetical protein